MTHIKASEFKARCLALMDEVALHGESFVITKNGRPVAELHPYRSGRADSPFGLNAGRIQILGDLVEPAVSLDDWEALRA